MLHIEGCSTNYVHRGSMVYGVCSIQESNAYITQTFPNNHPCAHLVQVSKRIIDIKNHTSRPSGAVGFSSRELYLHVFSIMIANSRISDGDKDLSYLLLSVVIACREHV